MLSDVLDDLLDALFRKLLRPRFVATLILTTIIVIIGTAAFKITANFGSIKQVLSHGAQQQSDIRLVSIVTALIFSVTAASVPLMLRYLRADSDPRDRFERLHFMHEIEYRLHTLERTTSGMTEETRKQLVQGLKVEAAAQIAEEFENRLHEKYAPAVEVLNRAGQVRAASDRISSRLQAEIRALMRRGNLNLVLGTVTTVAAVAVLAYIALTTTLSADSWRGYLPTFLLRLSLVAFIEIFAFFFLRLYRTSLTEIKYFQNEITNVESKCLALELAVLLADHGGTKGVVEELAKTERNFVLKKDQTTVELEKARIESQHIHDIARAIKDVLPVRPEKPR